MTPAEKEEGLSLTKGTKTRANGGFTLVEILVAIAILGVVATSMGGCLVVSQRVNARSQNVIEERAAVTNVVEKLMAEGIDVKDNSIFTPYQIEITPPAGSPQTYVCYSANNYEGCKVIAEPPKKSENVVVKANPFVEFGDQLWKVWVTCGDVEVVTYIHGKSS